MADEELVRILRDEGVEAWNRWREEHPAVRANLRGADLSEARLGRAELGGANLSRAILWEANLGGANLGGADLRGANLWRAYLVGADLGGAHLSGADLREADLREADLGQADLGQADLWRAYLVGADLGGANLIRADLSRADLSRADLGGAWVGGTAFGDVDLSGVKGLEAVKHDGPSTIGIDTIYRSKGKIPEVFLRGCGVPDGFITYIGSLVGRAIEYYSCFISYSSKDQEFAERVHADLQAKGVRCWFAPEDMKIGEKIWERLDQSIRLHDKLLVILSGNSIGSEWVGDEVMTAFEEERKRKKTVLFPVRLDDAVMGSGEAWAGLVRQRHIGDFRGWKEHDAYREGFERLVRDLKAEG